MNEKPNILVIVADQLRYDCVGYAGKYPVKTPNLDKLSAMGTSFHHAYSPQPICCPARQSMMTSRRPERDGLLWNYGICLETPWLAPKGEFWTQELKKMGYRSSYVGKWHVSPNDDPTSFGYDEFLDDIEYDIYRKKIFHGNAWKNEFLGETDLVPLAESRTHWLAGRAADKIRKLSIERIPWHVRLDFPEPHLPCRPCREFADMYKPDEILEWDGFREDFVEKPYIQKQQTYTWGVEKYTWKEWSEIVARYYAIISQMDDAVGKVLKALEDTGQIENTLIMFTADHGDLCGSHRMMDKHYVLYDDVVRVPLIIAWPGRLPGGMDNEEFVMNCLDMGPTILEAAGGRKLEDKDGYSLIKMMKGYSDAEARKEAVSTYNGQQFGLYTQRMIRTKEWKYIWNTTDTDELYEMLEDPGELHNRIHDTGCAEIVSWCRRRLYEILKKEGDGLVRTAWMRDQLLEKTKKL